jgi:hypothetical protein
LVRARLLDRVDEPTEDEVAKGPKRRVVIILTPDRLKLGYEIRAQTEKPYPSPSQGCSVLSISGP